LRETSQNHDRLIDMQRLNYEIIIDINRQEVTL
jgi:hypothetical protein